MFSASTQRTRTAQPLCRPACLSASCTERYASWSFTYLPTSAISTTSRRLCTRSSSSSQSDRSGSPSSSPSPPPTGKTGFPEPEPEPLADEPVEPLAVEHARDLVDVWHVRAGDDRSRVDV